MQPQQRAVIYAQEEGILDQLTVREGQQIKTGQEIGTLRAAADQHRRDQIQIKLEQARLQLHLLEEGPRREAIAAAKSQVAASQIAGQFADEEERRASALTSQHLRNADQEIEAKRAVSAASDQRSEALQALAVLRAGSRREDLAQAAARVAELESEKGAIDLRIERLTVRSPIDGVVVGDHLERLIGRRFKRGDKIFEVHDLSKIRPEVVVSSWEPLATLAPGEPVELRSVGDPTHRLRSTVARVRPKSSGDAEANVLVETQAIDNPGWPTGLTGHARIYGPRRSFAYLWIGVPLMQIFDYRAFVIFG